MKKQWILIVVLAALLVAAVIIASRSFPDVNETPNSNSTGTTQTIGSESTDPTDEDIDDTFPTVSYEEFQYVMSDPERQAYFDKFSSDDAFYTWLDEAKAKYDQEKENSSTPTINGDGPIDIGGLRGNNNG